MPQCNDAGLKLIESFEGVRLRAYPDPGTGAEPWTIGYGHTASVHPGQTCTQEQAIAFLRSDVHNAEIEVAAVIEIEITPNQFAALVSFEFNTGDLRESTLARCVNDRDFPAAGAEFGRWIYAGGSAMPGLIARRAAEARLFATR
jgi:lysozyme